MISTLIHDLSEYLDVHFAAYEVTYVTSIPRRYSKIIIVDAIFPDGRKRLYVKLVPSKNQDSAWIEFQLLTQLYDNFKRHVQYLVVRPVACLPQHNAIITEAAQGKQLQSILAKQSKIYTLPVLSSSVQAYCYHAGKWLQILHRDVCVEMSLPVIKLDDIVEYCMLRLDLLCEMGVIQSARYKDPIYTFLKDQELPMAVDLQERMTLLHGDYTTTNLLVQDDVITALDFTGAKFGSPYYDVCKFWLSLEELLGDLRSSHKTIARWQTTFLSGYGNQVDTHSSLFSIYQLPHRLASLLQIQRLICRSPLQRILTRKLYQRHWHAIDQICQC